MRNGVELIGVDQMLGSIRQKLNSGVDRLENQGLRAAGEIFADAQREKVAVSTVDHVHIRDDIKVSNVRRDMGERYVNIGPGIKTGWRAHFLEFGTGRLRHSRSSILLFMKTENVSHSSSLVT